ncbi:DUF4261 domain-containing protein [Pseudoflavonifractor sp. 60]|nr:DUF4261 domain-containing protein [Pseudoflavonifractor sp. 60]
MGLFKKKKQPERAPEPEKKSPLDEMDSSIRPGGVFMVQLLMKEQCETPSLEQMTQVLERHIGRVEAAPPSDDLAANMKDIALFAALDHIAKFSNSEGPVQVSVMPCDTFHPEKIDEMKRSQMWDCLPDRDRILSECKYCVFANDILTGALDPLERANFDMDFLEALLELFPTCEAVYSLNTGKLVLADVIRSRTVTGLDRFIRYIVNARFFNIENSGDHIVDTLGMSLLYIEDLQYHFHSMDPNWVVMHAYNIAAYILENRRPIQDGDTIDGVTDGQIDQSLQWKCHFEDAIVLPGRPVLDIHMGSYAAGGR